MISVGIDVSKGKSMVCILKPYGEVVCSPFEVMHTFSLRVHIHPAVPHMPIERSFVLYISSDEKRNIENDINVFYIPFKHTNSLFLRGHRNPLTI